MSRIYDNAKWDRARRRARERDGNRCTVARLLGGECSGALDVHHLIPVSEGGEPFDLDNLGTACDSHHPVWEALRRRLVGNLRPPEERPTRCPHHHRSAESRRICEARMARQRGLAAA